MSVRINLLPEARLLTLKSKQTRRLVTVISVIACSSVGIILITLLLLLGARNVQYATNTSKIEGLNKDIEAKKGVEQDLAWFNASLTTGAKLNDNRILISKLFDYLTKAVPDGVSIVDISVDKDYLVKADVKARDYSNVALFLKALNTFNVDYGFIDGLDRKQVFTDVDVAAVAKAKQSSGADFEITFKVDQDLVTKFRKDNAAKSSDTTKSSPSPSGGTQ